MSKDKIGRIEREEAKKLYQAIVDIFDLSEDSYVIDHYNIEITIITRNGYIRKIYPIKDYVYEDKDLDYYLSLLLDEEDIHLFTHKDEMQC